VHICPLLSFSSACLFKCRGEHKNIRPGPRPDIGTRLLSKERVRSKKANVCVSLYMRLHMCVCVCVCVCVCGHLRRCFRWCLVFGAHFSYFGKQVSHEWISLDERRRSMSNSKRDCRLLLAKLKYSCGFLKSSSKHRLCILLNLVEIGSSKHTARVCNLRESKLICHQARI